MNIAFLLCGFPLIARGGVWGGPERNFRDKRRTTVCKID